MQNRAVGKWLLIGAALIYIQVIIGGITRLTGSGLSITKWEIATGAIPPLDSESWGAAFELYKESPQYQKINQGMSLSEFKFIYFWEWFQRLWARGIGLAFIIPFGIFWARGKLRGALFRHAVGLFLLGGLIGAFGWFMVQSGLVDRPYVSPYRLAGHFILALAAFCWALNLGAAQLDRRPLQGKIPPWRAWLFGLCAVQLILGAVVSGMKAALVLNDWPLMGGQLVPAVLFDTSAWTWSAFVHSDTHLLAPALFQFLHRSLGYAIVVLVTAMWAKGQLRRKSRVDIGMTAVLGIQVALGIATLLLTTTAVPVWIGVSHQGVAILLVACVVLGISASRRETEKELP